MPEVRDAMDFPFGDGGCAVGAVEKPECAGEGGVRAWGGREEVAIRVLFQERHSRAVAGEFGARRGAGRECGAVAGEEGRRRVGCWGVAGGGARVCGECGGCRVEISPRGSFKCPVREVYGSRS